MSRVQVVIADEVYEAVKVLAASENRTVSNYVGNLLRRELEHLGVISKTSLNQLLANAAPRGTDTVAKRSSMPPIKNRDPLDYDAELDDVFSKLDD